EFGGRPVKGADAPGRLVGQPPVADLAGLHQGAHRLDLFGDRRAFTLGGGIEYGLSEVRQVPLGPVDLVEVDAVRLQAAQAGLAGSGGVGPVGVGASAAAPAAPARAGDLRRDHEGVAVVAGEPAPEVLLGATLGFG